MLTSAMSPEAVTAAVERIRTGAARLVYVAPERFTSARFLDAIAEAGVARLAVDEAHCLSEWGHDFRPDYLRLADVRERLGSPPTIALTATATPRVAADIATALRLRDPVMPRTGFDRPNLMFAVVPVAGDRDKPRVLGSLLHAPDALPAVVYCGRRRTCEEVADALSAGGLRASPYHAGLDSARRSATLTAFLAGELDVVCATTAFGMGIDKADVRSVVHWALPPSPEEYYQQAGRAGRDGLPARCTLLYARRDKGLIVHFINRARLAPTDLTGVHAAVAERADDRGVFRVRERDLGIDEPRVALAVLERAGALELFPAPAGLGRRPGRRRQALEATSGRGGHRGPPRRAAPVGPARGDRRLRDERRLPPGRAPGVLLGRTVERGARSVLRRVRSGCRAPARRRGARADARGRRRRAVGGAARRRRDRGTRRSHAHRPDSAWLARAGARLGRSRPARLVRRPHSALVRRGAPGRRLADRLRRARAHRRPVPAGAQAGRGPGRHRPRRRAARPGQGARPARCRGGDPVPRPRAGRGRGSRSCGPWPPRRSEPSAASAPRRHFAPRCPITTRASPPPCALR